MKYTKIFLSLLAVIIFIGCDNDIEIFDFVAQYKKERVVLKEYMQTHYYEASTDSIKEITENQESLFDKIDSTLVTFDEIDYYLYTYTINEGDASSENPDLNDIVNVSYKIVSLSGSEDSTNLGRDIVRDLSTQTTGFSNGLTKFKGGKEKTIDPTQPRGYENEGRGLIIIPSGLTFVSEKKINRGVASNPAPSGIYNITLRSVLKVEDE